MKSPGAGGDPRVLACYVKTEEVDMKYVVRVTETNPDGGTCGTQFVLCATERDMERMINAFKDGHDYTTVTCLGPLVEPPRWMKKIVDSYT